MNRLLSIGAGCVLTVNNVIYQQLLSKIEKSTNNGAIILVQTVSGNTSGDVNKIYKLLCGSLMQRVPRLVILVYDKDIMHSQAEVLKSICNASLTPCIIDATIAEVEDVLATYPGRVRGIFGDDIGSSRSSEIAWSNILRNVTLDLMFNMTHISKVYIVGYVPIIQSMIIGYNKPFLIVDILDQPRSPYDQISQEVKNEIATSGSILLSKQNGRSSNYRSPDIKVKRDQLLSLINSYRNMSMIAEYEHVLILTPAAHALLGTHLSDYGLEYITLTYRDYLKYDFKPLTNYIIIDDEYISGGKDLSVTDRNLEAIEDTLDRLDESIVENIYIVKRFNYNADKVVGYVYDIILTPGSNDSNEVRLLLNGKGTPRSINRRDVLKIMSRWRKLPVARQAYMFGAYIPKSVWIKSDVTDLDFKSNDGIHFTFGLTNVADSNESMTVQRLKTFLIKLNSSQTSMIFTAPSDLSLLYSDALSNTIIQYNGVGGDKKTFLMKKLASHGRVYTDLVLPDAFFAKHGYINIRDTILVNLAQESAINLERLDGYPMQARCTNIYMSRSDAINLLLPQSSYSTVGALIKAPTASLRSLTLSPANVTYQKRLELATCILQLKDYQYIPLGNSKTTLTFTRDLTVIIPVGNVKYQLKVKKNQEVCVSGHVLNTVVSGLLFSSNLQLWVLQWLYQNDELVDARRDRSLYESLFRANKLFDYDADENLLDPWHSTIDVLLAIAMSREYVKWLIDILLTHDYVVTADVSNDITEYDHRIRDLTEVFNIEMLRSLPIDVVVVD